MDKRCDGVLDFLNLRNETGPYKNVRNELYFADEYFCGQKWFGVYVTLFVVPGIGIIDCLAIWIFTWPAFVCFLKLFFKEIRQYICGYIPKETLHEENYSDPMIT